MIKDHLKSLYRIATNPKMLGWSPEMFWKATAAEFEMTVEGLAGDVRGGPFISREEVRRAAAEHGSRPSLKTIPKAKMIGGG
ncbi:phage tail assembly chaperone [Sinorhizobium medicae]|nr:phage tail assembly chaperone [Sinorhizobium medicae]MDX0882939.1 phage tail assembly chaperone [Sinorhizobium medicae]RVJ51286.1 phage tail assembly chaperone [Sinorhizobium medicae]